MPISPDHVLVVDDDPILFETAAAVLRARGATELVHARTVAEAVAHLKSDAQVDLVILDLNMPNTDGVEFLREVREQSGNVPIVISSSAHESVRTAALQLAKAYGLNIMGEIAKPLTVEKLDQILK